jgi:hypothetical protein
MFVLCLHVKCHMYISSGMLVVAVIPQLSIDVIHLPLVNVDIFCSINVHNFLPTEQLSSSQERPLLHAVSNIS